MRIIVTAAAVSIVAATGAFAKAHDQGGTEVPGAEDVGSVTVSSAQSLGGLVGGRSDDKGPSASNPANGTAGR